MSATMEKQQQQPLQDAYLETLRKENADVSIFLVNGIKLVGKIVNFDRYVIILGNTDDQVIYKSAISTIMPGRVATSHMSSKPEGQGPEITRRPAAPRRFPTPKDR